jgi:hypothetical protein
MEHMIVTIKDGSVEIEIEGVNGARCVGLSQAIEKLIGKEDNRFLKGDFYRDTKIEHTIYLKQSKSEKPFR